MKVKQERGGISVSIECELRTRWGDERLISRPWVKELAQRESFTASEAGQLSGRNSLLVMGDLRGCPDLTIIKVGMVQGKYRPVALYKLVIKS